MPTRRLEPPAAERALRRDAAERLLRDKEWLVLRVLDRLHLDAPDADEAWRDVGGRRYVLELLLFHVDHLGTAVAYDAPRTFRNHVAWSRDVLEARGVPAFHGAALLRALREELEAGVVPDVPAQLVVPFLADGERELARHR